MNVLAAAKDGAGTEKADSRDHLRRNAIRRTGASPQLDREDRKQRGTERDEHVRSEASRLVVVLALESDCTAQRGCQGEPQDRVGKSRRSHTNLSAAASRVPLAASF